MSMPLVLCREDGRTTSKMEGTNEGAVVFEKVSAVLGLGFKCPVAFTTGLEGAGVSLSRGLRATTAAGLGFLLGESCCGGFRFGEVVGRTVGGVLDGGVGMGTGVVRVVTGLRWLTEMAVGWGEGCSGFAFFGGGGPECTRGDTTAAVKDTTTDSSEGVGCVVDFAGRPLVFGRLVGWPSGWAFAVHATSCIRMLGCWCGLGSIDAGVSGCF
jgi:hypothetical protein